MEVVDDLSNPAFGADPEDPDMYRLRAINLAIPACQMSAFLRLIWPHLLRGVGLDKDADDDVTAIATTKDVYYLRYTVCVWVNPHEQRA